jgi:hypothetical protein
LFSSWFLQAFNLFNTSYAADATAACARTIIMLTDGEITDGLSAPDVIDQVNTRNAAYNATLFTYSLGSDADRKTTQSLA